LEAGLKLFCNMFNWKDACAHMSSEKEWRSRESHATVADTPYVKKR
jgi:hypothetical protein